MSLRECAIQCMTPHEHEIRLALHTHIEAKRGKAYKRDWVVGGSVRLRLFLWDRRKFPSVDVFRIFFFVAPFNSLHHRLRYVFIWLCVWPEKLTKAKKRRIQKTTKIDCCFLSVFCCFVLNIACLAVRLSIRFCIEFVHNKNDGDVREREEKPKSFIHSVKTKTY